MIESANIDILHRRPLQRNLFLDIKQSTASLRFSTTATTRRPIPSRLARCDSGDSGDIQSKYTDFYMYLFGVSLVLQHASHVSPPLLTPTLSNTRRFAVLTSYLLR